jgi:Tol biopolymer transport system component
MKQLGKLILLLLLSTTACTRDQEGVTFIPLVHNPLANHVVWSPVDPNLVLITAHDYTSLHSRVYLMSLAPIDERTIIESEFDDIRGLSWSPDGNSILLAVYSSISTDLEPGLWLFDLHDETFRYISQAGNAAWSPVGDLIAVYTPPHFIRLVNLNTGQERVIFEVSDNAFVFGLSWSPDGRKLVFSVGEPTKGELYIFDMETDQTSQLTFGGGNTLPVWSPLGNMIAYIKDNSLHLISPDGICDIEVPDSNSLISYSWSPNGKRLASIRKGDLYIFDLQMAFGIDINQALCP